MAATAPSWHVSRELKKKSFSAPSTCPIDLFGPVANGTVLKRLHVAFVSKLVCLSPSSACSLAEDVVQALSAAIFGAGTISRISSSCHG